MLTVIEPLTADDWSAVRAIYLEGIATGHATFEKTAPDWEVWDAGHLKTCRLAARSKGEVLGWAALSLVSGRCVYAGVAGVSVSWRSPRTAFYHIPFERFLVNSARTARAGHVSTLPKRNDSEPVMPSMAWENSCSRSYRN